MTAAAPALKVQPPDLSIQPRNIAFVREGLMDAHWLGGDPVKTAWFNALSLTFPDGERFFIDAVKAHRHFADGKLADDVRDFIMQEALHTREHVALNGTIDRARYPIDKIEEMIRWRTNLGRKRGPMTMLVITICLEHFTAILADSALRNADEFKGAPDEIGRLWLWHAVEETEHKSVAFDLWQRAATSWSRWRRWSIRARAMALISFMFHWNATSYALMMLKADGISGFTARRRLYGYLWGRGGQLRRVFGAYCDWFRPGFHPWDHDNRELLTEYQAMFAEPYANRAVAAE